MRKSGLTLISVAATAGLVGASAAGAIAQEPITIDAASVPITVDGDAADWADVPATAVMLEQLDLSLLPPEQAGLTSGCTTDRHAGGHDHTVCWGQDTAKLHVELLGPRQTGAGVFGQIVTATRAASRLPTGTRRRSKMGHSCTHGARRRSLTGVAGRARSPRQRA